MKKSPSFKIVFDRRLRSFQNNFSTKVCANQWGIEIGRERGGPAIVSKLVMSRQDFKRSSLLRLQVSDSITNQGYTEDLTS